MSKLIAFVGSPRKNGNIDTLLKEVIKGAEETNIETKIYYLNEMNITPCQSCMY
ncbi:MAG: NAD(P)H-dependent oxidoreductase, partial [Vallitaleaceae bacterium]|nr:NAD(P)H-dependent oxidoreductase [Vallitaleaceae bacterium]